MTICNFLHKQFSTLFLVATLVLFDGCSKNNENQREGDTKVQGQVFIVQNDGQSLKLGLVTISVYSIDVVQQVALDELTEVIADIRSKRSWLESNSINQEIKNRLESLDESDLRIYQHILSREMIRRFSVDGREGESLLSRKNAYEIISGGDPGFWLVVPGSQVKDLVDVIEKSGESLERAFEILNEIQEITDSATMRCIQKLPQPSKKTKTDADGYFTIAIPQNQPHLLVANATRTVFGKQESYAWIVKPPINQQEPFFLSNDNMGFTGLFSIEKIKDLTLEIEQLTGRLEREL